MTREKASRYAPLLEAYGLGKDIQIKMSTGWEDITDPGFNNDDPSVYRIKPEPQWRAWNAEEVPVGKLIKNNQWVTGTWGPSLILGASNRGIEFIDNFRDETFTRFSLEWVFENCSWSDDNGQTWKPCGVEL